MRATLLLPLALAALLAGAPRAQAEFTCGSGDPGRDVQYVPWRFALARQLRSAVLDYCRRARGKQRDHCRLVAPLARRSRCPLEFYQATAKRPASVGLGTHPAAEELSWYALLRRGRGRWIVTSLVYDDLERP